MPWPHTHTCKYSHSTSVHLLLLLPCPCIPGAINCPRAETMSLLSSQNLIQCLIQSRGQYILL